MHRAEGEAGWLFGPLIELWSGDTEERHQIKAAVAERTRGTSLQSAMEAFLAAHGHRGNDEYELARPALVMDPAPVYAAIDRLRHAPADRDPIATTRRLAADAEEALSKALPLVPWPLRLLARRAADIAREGSIGRERAKDIFVLENLGARQVLHELVRRAAERGGPTDVRLAFCVTAENVKSDWPHLC